MSETVKFIIAIVFLLLAMICDIATGKIKNWLTFPVLTAGLFYVLHYEPAQFKPLLLTLVAMFALGCIGVSGWGDIKCVMALSTIVGWKTSVASYLLAQVFLFVRYMIATPKQAIQEAKRSAVQLATKNVVIDKTKKKHLLAPYLLAGYICACAIRFFL